MSEPVKISIPAAVAACIKPGIPLQERLQAAAGAVVLPAREQVLLLFCLSKDPEAEVRHVAAASMAALDQTKLLEALDGSDYHPAVLHALAQLHGADQGVRSALLACSGLAEVTRTLLQAHVTEALAVAAEEGTEQPVEELSPETDASSADTTDPPADEWQAAEDDIEEDTEAEISEDDEEYLSKYKLAQVMGIGEKIKMALSGDKEWRKILIKDANKLVSSGVIKNPRMTDAEVLIVLKSGVQNDEIIRLICANKEWVKNYQIRKALIENPKTPVASALRYLGTMGEKDVANYAKSRNITSVISTQAKRMLLNKKR